VRNRTLLGVATLATGALALPPLSTVVMRLMLTQMLAQIPLIFLVAALWPAYLQRSSGVRSTRWNAQGAPGLLFLAIVLACWMTPIALDHAASNSRWEVAKIASLIAAGISAGMSWRLSSNVARVFYVGNMVWMTITAGLLYQDATERLCNAYLWDDQAITGQALVGVSIIFAATWILILARQSMRPLPAKKIDRVRA
jgi:hypothetical protein